jgi:hypothetical protein
MAQSQSSSPNYDEQIGLTFTDTFASLAYNVTAVSQANSDGYGPAYLLNGLTEKGYWYQVGVSWNWNPGTTPGTGFAMNYEVWDTNGYSIFPTDGGGGLAAFSGAVNSGDRVLLILNFTSGSVVMHVSDLTTGAVASIRYSSEGASSFVGLIYPSDSHGYFSGLMTEEYHSSPYFGNELAVNYTSSTPLANGFLWADEFTVSPRSSVFYGQKFVTFTNPSLIQTFSRNGSTSYANAKSFVTGALNEESLTLRFTVVGGGTGYGAPLLTYVLNGSTRTATITSTAASYMADTGSAWSVSTELRGGSGNERWMTSNQTGGTLTSFVSETLTYYHQYLCVFGYKVVGGGAGYSPPSVLFVQNGKPSTTAGLGISTWIDSGTDYNYSTSLGGGAAGERWEAGGTTSGVITGPLNPEVAYRHQYGLTVSYVLLGGGSPSAPVLSGIALSEAFSFRVANSTTYYIDSGTSWSVPRTLMGGSIQERWTTSSVTGGNASAPATILLKYQHQYTLGVYASPTNAGSVSQPGLWQNAGSTVRLSGNASTGWKFWYWMGVNTSTTNETTVKIDGPIIATAVFIPGLRITAGSNGAVTYFYGSETETVPAGTSKTIFAGQGVTFKLQASPSSFLYAFSGWSENLTGTNGTLNVLVESPKSVTASFAVNTPVVGGISAVALVAVAVTLLALLRRGRARQLT